MFQKINHESSMSITHKINFFFNRKFDIELETNNYCQNHRDGDYESRMTW